MKNEEHTTGLFKILENADMKNGFQDYTSHHPVEKELQSFADFISDYVSTHEDIPIRMISNHCGFGSDYARDILCGKRNGSRDRILAICFAAKMDLKDTRRALKIAKCGDLYPKIPRDMALIICLNNQCYDIDEVNRFLDDNGCEMLQLERKLKEKPL